jgi:hypothetical protein
MPGGSERDRQHEVMRLLDQNYFARQLQAWPATDTA